MAADAGNEEVDNTGDDDMDPNENGEPEEEEPEELEGDESEELLCPPCEERVSKSIFEPMKPSPKEVADHERTHVPYRCWCNVCVRAKGKEAAHRRGKAKTKGGLPRWCMDYATLGEAEDEKDSMKALESE